VPVIVVSAYAPEVVQEGQSGAPAFFDALLKPVHYEDLKAALQRALAERHTAG
jgi:CheY-like chemotaxis protein